jgi:hypothetical protein
MSNVDLKDTAIMCDLNRSLHSSIAGYDIQFEAFARRLIEVQDAEKVDELGDVIVVGAEVTDPICAELGIDTEQDRIRNVEYAVTSCLEKRYLGICAVANCSGREVADRLIEAIQNND